MGSFQDYPSSSKDSAGVTRQLFLPAETRPSKHRFSQWGSVIPAANWVEDEDDEVLEAANRHSKSFRERVPESKQLLALSSSCPGLVLACSCGLTFQ